MTMAKDGNTYYTSFEVKGQVTTADETIVHQFTKEPFLELTESQLREVIARPFSYRDMFPLAGGEFIFRLVFKNKAQSEYTIFETPLQVEEMTDAPFLGNPVLLNRAGELSDPEASGVYRTYQIGSVKLEPNTKQVYAIGQTLVALIPVENVKGGNQIFLRVVSRDDPAQELVSKNVSLENYRGAPVVESIELEKLAGGRYQLAADLLDPTGEVLSSRSADFDVTPRSTLLRPWVMRESIDGEKTALVRAALAEQYLVLGNVAKTRELCQKALEENPNLMSPRIVLGRLHLDEKQPVEAIKLLEPAHAQSKENVEVLLTLGDAHVQAGNYQRAADLFEAALVLRRPTPALLNALAVSYAQMGDSEKARQYLERSLELEPEQEEAKTLLEKLPSP
jgi:tetratricopeptide (TPR) repeat protein